MSKSDDYATVLLEEMNSKFDLLMEGQAQILEILDQKADKEDIQRLENKLNVIEVVVTEHSHQAQNLERRVTKLEAKRV